MAADTDDKNNYAIKLLMFTFMTVVLFFDSLYYAYNFFYDIGLDGEFFANILKKLYDYGIYSNRFSPKYFALVFMIVGLLGNKPRKDVDLNKKRVWLVGIFGILIFFIPNIFEIHGVVYLICSFLGAFLLVYFITSMQKIIGSQFLKDRFDVENTQCLQNDKYLPLDTSVNIPYTYYYQKKEHTGWINIVNPFRAVMVCGVPGSGKTFAILEEAIRQLLEKGFCMCVYDFKFPDLTETTWSYLCEYFDNYDVKPKFYVLNFDDPRYSHRCNPLQPELMTEFSDANEAAQTIMLGMNRSWIKKQGDFFVESPINLTAAGIWVLRQIDLALGENKFCTFPHLIELLSMEYDDMFGVLTAVDDMAVANVMSPFLSAWVQQATDQLEGQIASVRLGLSRLSTPSIYWAMTGADFTLEINDPKEPKILCIGNNPDRQAVYGTVLSLYSSKMMKLINHKGRRRCALFYDELPTVFLGTGTLDNLIATGRSNKLATFMGIQDFSQIIRDYGKEAADAILNTVGSIITGQVGDHTAKQLSDRIGKIKVRRNSVNVSRNDTSINMSEAMEPFVKVEQLCQMGQGEMAGVLADDVKAPMDFKMFYGHIKVDMVVKKLAKKHKMPTFTDFGDADVNQILEENLLKIRREVKELCTLLNFKYEDYHCFNDHDFMREQIAQFITYTRNSKKQKIINLFGETEYNNMINNLADFSCDEYSRQCENTEASNEAEFVKNLGLALRKEIAGRVDKLVNKEEIILG